MSATANAPESFVDRERARSLLHAAGLDTVRAAPPLNVYYLTGVCQVMGRFAQVPVTAAVPQADPAQPIAFVAGAFEFHAGAAEFVLHQLPRRRVH